MGGWPVTYHGSVMRPGEPFSSPRFRAAGVEGFLRFWPSGYWTDNQRRKHTLAPPQRDSSGVSVSPPSSDAWCCIGACFPACTHLCMRFFVCDAMSDKRECYWNAGVHMSSIWGPPTKTPPAEVSRGDAFVVGVEIFQNRGDPPAKPANRHATLKHLDHGKREGDRPTLRPKIPIVPRY